MTTPKLFVQSITFNSGQTLKVAQNDIIVFVGANNVGKSATLRDIVQRARSEQYNPNIHQIVNTVNLSKEGSLDEYRNWISSRFIETSGADPIRYTYDGNSISGTEYFGTNWETLTPDQYGQLMYPSIFWKSLDVLNRFYDQGSAYQVGVNQPQPHDPIQKMYEDPDLELRLSNLFRSVFGMDLVVNRYGGGSIPLHVGKRPVPKNEQSYYSPEFAQVIRSLPYLSTQGNGMRAFVGLLISCLFQDYKSAIFVDEPEVYLHPPQSRKLGQFLAEKTATQMQLFMATHNGAFIRGILDAATDRVRIIRISRENEVNHIHELSNADIQSLWGDTILKYSNVLDGLFHKRVIICESDSDCTLFAALRNAQGNGEGDDVMFLSAGGKDRVAKLAHSLSSIGVNVKAALDFDVLNQDLTMTRIVEALGGNWENISKDYNIVLKSVEQKRPELAKDQVFNQIQEIINNESSEALSRGSIRNINSVLKRSNVWSNSKLVGSRIIPPGDPTQAWQRLNSYCKSIGFHIIPSGEVESFVPEIGGHAQKWVNEVMKLDLSNDPKLSNAREFVNRFFTD